MNQVPGQARRVPESDAVSLQATIEHLTALEQGALERGDRSRAEQLRAILKTYEARLEDSAGSS